MLMAKDRNTIITKLMHILCTISPIYGAYKFWHRGNITATCEYVWRMQRGRMRLRAHKTTQYFRRQPKLLIVASDSEFLIQVWYLITKHIEQVFLSYLQFKRTRL